MKIKTLKQLKAAADSKKSVVCAGMFGGKRMPAAFVMNMSASIVFRMIESGIYVYKPQPRK